MNFFFIFLIIFVFIPLTELYVIIEDQQGNELYSSRDSVRAAAGRVEQFKIIL